MVIIKKILMLLGIVFICYGLLVIGIIGTGSWVNFIFGLAGIFLVIISVFLDKIIALPKVVLIAAAVLVAAVLVDFVSFEAKLLSFSGIPQDDAKYVIVLGAKVNVSGPSLEFYRRIEAAADYAKKNPRSKIVTTGGKGQDEPIEEGISAKNELLRLGIDESRIIVEKTSTSTKENFSNALEILLSEDENAPDEKTVIVSSRFHLFRADEIAKTVGFKNTSYLGVVGKKILLPQYYVREYGAYILEKIK